jgi:hypothetical protein
MTPAETLIAAAERLERDTADLRRTWLEKELPASERMARRVAIDTALSAHLRAAGENAPPAVQRRLLPIAAAVLGVPRVPAEEDDTLRCHPVVNDAAERFDAADLLEALVEEAEGDCLVLDGGEWWVTDTETEPGSFTITNDDNGESYRVELDARIRKAEKP